MGTRPSAWTGCEGCNEKLRIGVGVGTGGNEEGLDPSLPRETNDVFPSTGLTTFTTIKLHVVTNALQNIRGRARLQDFVPEVDDASFDPFCVTETETWREEAETIFHTSYGHSAFLSGGTQRFG